MKPSALLFFALAIVGLAQARPLPHDPDAFNIEAMLRDLQTKLQASPAQLASARGILNEAQTNLAHARTTYAADERLLAKEVRIIRRQAHDNLRTLFAEAQFAAFDALRAEWEAQYKDGLRQGNSVPHDHGHQTGHTHPH